MSESPSEEKKNALDDKKPWYASTTMQAAFGLIAINLFGLFGLHIAGTGLEVDIYAWLIKLVEVILGGVVLWGRLYATKKIG